MGISSKRFQDFDTLNPATVEQNALALPPGAAERLAHFRDLDLKSKAFIAARSEKIAEVKEMIAEQERQRWHKQRDIEHSGKQPGRYHDRGDGRMEFEAENWEAPICTKISAYKAEIARLQKQPTPYSPLPIIVEFLGSVRGLLTDSEQPQVKAKVGESLADFYKRSTALTDAAYQKLHEIVIAPKPSAVVMERVRAEIAQLARQGRPRLGAHFAGGRHTETHGKFIADTPNARIGWPMQHLAFDSKGEQVAATDVLRLVAWLLEGELLEALGKLIHERVRDGKAVHPNDKPALIEAAQREIIQVLRLETEIAFQCERAGIAVERRKDVPAPILLGLEVRPNVIDPATAI